MPFTSTAGPHSSYNINSEPLHHSSNHYQESDSEQEVVKHYHYHQEDDSTASLPVHSGSPSPPSFQMSSFSTESPSSAGEKKRFAGGFDPYGRTDAAVNGGPGSRPTIVGEDKLQEKMESKGKYANLIPVQKPPTSPVSIKW